MTETTNHYVYVLECGDGTYYTGYTNDMDKRMTIHEAGKGAKYTRGRGPFKLLYQQCFSTKSEALQKEYALKRLSRSKKEALIRGSAGKEESS